MLWYRLCVARSSLPHRQPRATALCHGRPTRGYSICSTYAEAMQPVQGLYPLAYFNNNYLWYYLDDLRSIYSSILTFDCCLSYITRPVYCQAINHYIKKSLIIIDQLSNNLTSCCIEYFSGPAVISLLGYILKYNRGWRRIYDLSWLLGYSINNIIPDIASAI